MLLRSLSSSCLTVVGSCCSVLVVPSAEGGAASCAASASAASACGRGLLSSADTASARDSSSAGLLDRRQSPTCLSGAGNACANGWSLVQTCDRRAVRMAGGAGDGRIRRPRWAGIEAHTTQGVLPYTSGVDTYGVLRVKVWALENTEGIQ